MICEHQLEDDCGCVTMTPTTPDPKPAPATDEEIAKLRVELGNLWTWGSSPELAVHREHYMHLVYAAHKCFAAIEAERSENAKLRARVAELEEGLRGIETRLFGLAVDTPICQLHRMALSNIVDFIRAALKPEPASR